MKILNIITFFLFTGSAVATQIKITDRVPDDREIYSTEKKDDEGFGEVYNPYYQRINQLNTRKRLDQNTINKEVVNSIAKGDSSLSNPSQQEKPQTQSQTKAPVAIGSSLINRTTAMADGIKNKINSSKFFSFGVDQDELKDRPSGIYKSVVISTILYGSSHMKGTEERPNSSSNTTWNRYRTFDGDKAYMPSIEIGLRVGKNIYPFLRTEFSADYSYLWGNVSSVSSHPQSPGANFTLKDDFLNGHMIKGIGHLYLEPFPKWKIWPSIGAGVGVSYIFTNNMTNNAIFAPTISGYFGFNKAISKQMILSIGYRMDYFWNTVVDNRVPIHDASGKFINDRPTNTDQTLISNLMIHKLEIGFRFF